MCRRICQTTIGAVWETFLFRRLFLAALLGGGALCGAAAASAPPTGRFLTDDHQAVIEVANCGTGLCGRIIGMVFDHPSDPQPLDWQGHPQCGEQIITATPTQNGPWQGTVLDPRSGAVYHATLWLDGSGNLNLHGYVLAPLLGQTQIWHPFTGQILPGCQLKP
jgi:uncharacterized protein (DUF2147 family)